MDTHGRKCEHSTSFFYAFKGSFRAPVLQYRFWFVPLSLVDFFEASPYGVLANGGGGFPNKANPCRGEHRSPVREQLKKAPLCKGSLFYIHLCLVNFPDKHCFCGHKSENDFSIYQENLPGYKAKHHISQTNGLLHLSAIVVAWHCTVYLQKILCYPSALLNTFRNECQFQSKECILENTYTLAPSVSIPLTSPDFFDSYCFQMESRKNI